MYAYTGITTDINIEVFMIQTTSLKKTPSLHLALLISTFILLFSFTQSVLAEGVFLNKKKAQHVLTGQDLNRLKAEHQIKFGKVRNSSSSFNSNNPWEKKKQKARNSVSKASWSECRDYALHKRNRCYREGRDAYRCEQMYETRSKLCDRNL